MLCTAIEKKSRAKHRKRNAGQCFGEEMPSNALDTKCQVMPWIRNASQRAGNEQKRTAQEKLRLPRTCAGEAGQSHGEEVLYNALELNSNRFHKKKGDN